MLYPIPPQKHQLCYSTIVDTEVDTILQPCTHLFDFMSTCVCSSPIPVYCMDKDELVTCDTRDNKDPAGYPDIITAMPGTDIFTPLQ